MSKQAAEVKVFALASAVFIRLFSFALCFLPLHKLPLALFTVIVFPYLWNKKAGKGFYNGLWKFNFTGRFIRLIFRQRHFPFPRYSDAWRGVHGNRTRRRHQTRQHRPHPGHERRGTGRLFVSVGAESLGVAERPRNNRVLAPAASGEIGRAHV